MALVTVLAQAMALAPRGHLPTLAPAMATAMALVTVLAQAMALAPRGHLPTLAPPMATAVALQHKGERTTRFSECCEWAKAKRRHRFRPRGDGGRPLPLSRRRLERL